MAKPSFLIYEIASKIAGAVIKAVGLKDFCYDLQAMKRAVTPRTKVVFLGNPDNPSGKYFTQKQMEDFLKGLRNNVLVFVDEAYYEYVRARDYVDSVRLLKTHKNVIIARTFSKMYGLAGLRIGYGIADEEVIACLNRIREPFNVNTLAQAAAIACLNDQRYYKDVARKVERQRRWLYDNLRKLDLKCIESYTNFVLIDGLTDATIIAGRLLKKGIIVRDMRPWGLNNCIRVTIGTEPENRKFLKALKEIL
jgi:histidinol-phosphate aminotransferase